MSQIEQSFAKFLSRRPEIENCYKEKLINRRSLARYLIKEGIVKNNQLEATIAMLRRFNFKTRLKTNKSFFKNIKMNVKDNILILDFMKEKELVHKLQKLITSTNYDRGDTLKIVVGSSSVKVFIDEDNKNKIDDLIEKFQLKNKFNEISEISVIFPQDIISEKGVVSTITTELAINDIVITELLTATPELLIYVNEKFVIKTYELLKRLKN